MVCYLQPDFIVRPLKAAVGEDVVTAYGEGKVESYRLADDTYTICFSGWTAKLYAKGGETFDRVANSMQDKDGPFGMNWLLSMLFSSSSTVAGENHQAPRSRSNSLVSVSARSQSGRSLS